MPEQRRFHRIAFDASASIETSADEHIHGIVRDISLKGALIATSASYPLPSTHDTVTVRLSPEQGDIELCFQAEVAYIFKEKHTVGLSIQSMDIDTATFLRRLVEINLGDEALLERELSNLISSMA